MREIANTTELGSVLTAAGNKPVIADFYTNNCAPCKHIAPIFEGLESKYSGKAIFIRVNCEVAQDVARQYMIKGTPTFVFWHQGTKVNEVVGADQAKLTAAVEEIIKQFNVFESGSGYSMIDTSVEPAQQGSQRRNPWADPNFAPPYLRGLVQEEKKQDATEMDTGKFSQPTVVENVPIVSDVKEELDDETGALSSQKENDPRLQVNQNLLAELMEMGFSQVRAEKSLILTGNEAVDAAIGWLEEHQDDPDIDEPLQIVGVAQGDDINIDELDAGDADLIEKIKKDREKKRKEYEKLMKDKPDKDMSEMSTEEKLEYIENLRVARKQHIEISEKAEKKKKERDRRDRVKQSLKTKNLREQQEADRAARARKREKQRDKERKRRIREKIASQKRRT